LDVFCGIDWAEDRHDIALADRDGKLLARLRISDDAAGPARLLELLADWGDSAGDPVPVAIETPRGLLTACLRATGRKVCPVNPMAAARYRDRHSVAGRKSDHGDAFVLANVLRTDLHAHRPLPDDSELAQAIAVLARAQQAPLPPARVLPRLPRRLRRRPRRHHAPRGPRHPGRRPHPGRSGRTDPGPAARPAEQSRAQPRHRRRGRPAARRAARPADAPAPARRAGHGPAVPGPGTPAGCGLRQRSRPRGRRHRVFNQHPDAGIITSFPGLGPLTGARVLAETGDDQSRFQDAKGLKAYAGAAPITRASGKSRSVTHRRVKNNRLAAAGYIWAFSALTASPGARAHYDRRKHAADRHAAAQRNLFSRLPGCPRHCLATGQHYNEDIAFPPPARRQQDAA
jgi:hypothetical protein